MQPEWVSGTSMHDVHLRCDRKGVGHQVTVLRCGTSVWSEIAISCLTADDQLLLLLTSFQSPRISSFHSAVLCSVTSRPRCCAVIAARSAWPKALQHMCCCLYSAHSSQSGKCDSQCGRGQGEHTGNKGPRGAPLGTPRGRCRERVCAHQCTLLAGSCSQSLHTMLTTISACANPTVPM